LAPSGISRSTIFNSMVMPFLYRQTELSEKTILLYAPMAFQVPRILPALVTA
jgi:hypothetical protein